MITTFTLNAAIDKTYYVPGVPAFGPGNVVRASRMFAQPGGKGINVARVVHQLGLPVRASGIVGGSNGAYIERALSAIGIGHEFVAVEGESRLCLNMISDADGSSLELLESGPVVPAEAVEALKRKVSELASTSRIVSFSGSIPQGVPTGIYRELATLAKEAGARVFLDASGAAMLAGIEAAPHLIKPNQDEAQVLLGRAIEKEADLAEWIVRCMEQGIASVIVSLGGEGALAGHEGALYRVRSATIDVVNAVGCGDAFVAGMAVATAEDRPADDALRFAAAVGTANALSLVAGDVKPDDVKRLYAETAVTRIH
ncbi:MAG: 1-phosphofructokinase family hexose kinase [Paenibacillaceae bacterium]|nr:1-phosphofructokinase family hexose kinase [Paenibacillaceae bacterium]